MTDFRLTNHGSICLLTPLTPAAQEWVDEHLPEDALSFGDGVAIESRYVGPIRDGLLDDGLTLE